MGMPMRMRADYPGTGQRFKGEQNPIMRMPKVEGAKQARAEAQGCHIENDGRRYEYSRIK
jgi:hypothetical protein